MTGCPFTPDRLRELYWVELWTPAQIATLAQAVSEQPVDAARVCDWLSAAGIRLREAPAPAPAPAPRPPRKRTPRAPRQPGEGMLSEPCAYCGALVQRTPDRMRGERVFCGPEHHRAWQRAQTAARRAIKSERSQSHEGEKTCPKCGQTKALADFSRDVSRADGHTRTCKACNDAKSRAYYLAHQERLQARARARKLAQRAPCNEGAPE